ncbi:pyridoxamine 5'-phosphate oxidase family protein [Pseudonocardia sp.]|uniref:pyridoxamine 5'-phosphate oxidase family protein n=1 Tax=Pseudonocardia sp. TaxID=60912 RepID=UPI003D0D7295
MSSTGAFHEGELLVQRRAELTAEAARLAGMLGPPDLNGAMGRFAAERRLALLTSRDGDGRLWTSAVHGPQGFLRARAATLTVAALPLPGDPLHELQEGEQAGLLLVDFDRRRRLRVNGVLRRVDGDGFEVAVDQAFGNCPKYIQQRQIRETAAVAEARPTVTRHRELDPAHVAQVRRADTFVLGTAHPTRGADTSHRGGAAGFVRVERDGLWWPDYPGNNMFNSLGNIAANPVAALLFLDFGSGTSLQVSGPARLDWTPRGVGGDDGGTGRRVHVRPERVVHTAGLPMRLLAHQPYAGNPVLT